MRFGKHCLLVFALTLLPGTALSGQPYQGPIIDAHGHLGASFNWETMVEVMDSNNVTRRTVMARYYPGGAHGLTKRGRFYFIDMEDEDW